MRIVATGMLIAKAALFLISRRMAAAHPVWGYALAFAEAAMVGGLADWFAVTALFRRPGLPIPQRLLWRAAADQARLDRTDRRAFTIPRDNEQLAAGELERRQRTTQRVDHRVFGEHVSFD